MFENLKALAAEACDLADAFGEHAENNFANLPFQGQLHRLGVACREFHQQIDAAINAAPAKVRAALDGWDR